MRVPEAKHAIALTDDLMRTALRILILKRLTSPIYTHTYAHTHTHTLTHTHTHTHAGLIFYQALL